MSVLQLHVQALNPRSLESAIQWIPPSKETSVPEVPVQMDMVMDFLRWVVLKKSAGCLPKAS